MGLDPGRPFRGLDGFASFCCCKKPIAIEWHWVSMPNFSVFHCWLTCQNHSYSKLVLVRCQDFLQEKNHPLKSKRLKALMNRRNDLNPPKTTGTFGSSRTSGCGASSACSGILGWRGISKWDPSGGDQTLEFYGNFQGVCCQFILILHSLAWWYNDTSWRTVIWLFTYDWNSWEPYSPYYHIHIFQPWLRSVHLYFQVP